MRLSDVDSIEVPNGVVRAMAALLRKAGFDPTDALHAAGIAPDQVMKPAELSGRQTLDFQHQFVRRTAGRHDLWLELGLNYRVVANGVYGLAIMSAPTLADVLELSDWALDLSHSLSRWVALREGDDCIGIRQDRTHVPRELQAFTMYHDIAGGTTTYREVLPHAWTELELRVPLAEPERAQIARMCNWPRVTWGPEVEFRWAPEVSRLAMPHADAVVYHHYREQCRQTLDRFRTATFSGRLAKVLHSQQARPVLALAAGAMNVSVRTLQRRLDQSGQTFRAMVDRAREQAAKERLVSSTEPIAAIAFGLGYRSQTSFNHAFRRWTGTSPSSFRENRRTEAEVQKS